MTNRDTVRFALDALLAGRDLEETGAADLMRALTDDSLPPALAGAVLAALRAKGETPAEVRGFATAMRALARQPQVPEGGPVADVVGTGGDGSGSLNLSTGTALLVAATGVRVVKHGNRSISSKSGSADVLEALGVALPDNENAAMAQLARCGFTFLFAPFYHPAMKAIAPVRQALGIRTVFNLMGPLTNPAVLEYGLLGAFSPEAAALMAETLSGMAIRRIFVVHGEPGWDEATPVGPFELYDVQPGHVRREVRDPRNYGLARCKAEDLAGGDAQHNARQLEAVLSGADTGPHRDALALGAALTLEVTGVASSPQHALSRIDAALDGGAGTRLLQSLRRRDG